MTKLAEEAFASRAASAQVGKSRALVTRKYKSLVMEIRDILWADDDPFFEWTVETIEHVADVLIRAGLRPKEKQA